ncbi:MAG: hypothetical protein SFX18_03065 [Pirellulales bacterium]|nr:hypothetical protein [Pirellulales bacterium]
MPKIELDNGLFERATQAATLAGYSSVQEFAAHCLEQEISRLKLDDAEKLVTDQLRGLGYIE